jgi:hypothetical protein
VALLQRLTAVVVPTVENPRHGVLQVIGWLQRRHPGACFAPTDFAKANQATGVFEKNSVSAGTAIRLHANWSRVGNVCEQSTQKSCRRKLSADFTDETQMDEIEFMPLAARSKQVALKASAQICDICG